MLFAIHVPDYQWRIHGLGTWWDIIPWCVIFVVIFALFVNRAISRGDIIRMLFGKRVEAVEYVQLYILTQRGSIYKIAFATFNVVLAYIGLKLNTRNRWTPLQDYGYVINRCSTRAFQSSTFLIYMWRTQSELPDMLHYLLSLTKVAHLQHCNIIDYKTGSE